MSPPSNSSTGGFVVVVKHGKKVGAAEVARAACHSCPSELPARSLPLPARVGLDGAL